ncbi:M48 family metallopeptidase [Vogesella sp. LIG4]|uniref:tetratricopeptide repeat protein n=1 Tax=Vogesella sp. LIG4 TaxID=1192162 RepID=UPI00081FC088|nr:hypothetical protein [Vogesella sp. LIG4]SCK15377.1 hypothetical protein PSELUDRAFT_1523 [Vogesella sp. LIG4]
MSGKPYRQVLLFVMLGVLAQPAVADECDDALAGAEADWHAGRVAEVARKLHQNELACAAHARYNLVLGEALLAAGRAADAVMPLERAVALAPEEQGGWRALAQAWLQLGEGVPLPRQAQAAEGESWELGRTLHWQFGLEQTRGHDDNASQATAQPGIRVPALGDIRVILSPMSRRRGDSYWAHTLSADGQWLASPATALHLGLADARRNYDNLGVFSTEERNIAADVQHDGSYGNWQSGIQYDSLRQAGILVRQSVAGNVAWQPSPTLLLRPTFGLDLGGYRYQGGKQAPDGYVEKGMSVSGSLPLGPLATAWSLRSGRDFSTVRRADGDRDFLGLRWSASGALTQRIDWFGWVERTDSHYHDSNPAFLAERHDVLNGFTAGLGCAIYRGLSLRSQLSLSRQHSNIPLYDYQRTDMSLSLRYELGR